MKPRTLRTVFLPIPVSVSYGREVLRGIRDYAATTRAWEIIAVDTSEKRLRWIAEKGSGEVAAVLGYVAPAAVRSILKPLNVPMVNVSAAADCTGLPSVLPDNVEIGRIAARHLIERGFTNFAFVGYPSHPYSNDRLAGARDALEQAGLSRSLAVPNNWNQKSSWYQMLRKPVAIMTANDYLAVRILPVLREAGLRVPEDVALIGVDNDDLECEFATPPLSSVDPNARGVGYTAAEVLNRILEGGSPPDSPILVRPIGIVQRASTDKFAVADVQLARAMRMIHDHACDPISVYQIVERLEISRSTFEKRFRDVIGHSPHDELRRVRLERAKAMLTDSRAPITEIARRCGFSDSKRFSTIFREESGFSPQQFRQEKKH